MKILIRHKKDLPYAAKKILRNSGKIRLFAFYGPLGSGKTTIIKAICSELGATDPGSSPSFTIVNEYLTTNGDILYHIDFYRIVKPEELFDFGIEEYLYSGSYCFMEWPEIVEEILPAGTLKISITVGEKDERILELN
ncbi:MAG TPA: tRNA (adenosine(37)-N6)-threonylcarbamoyltransferase complex ATPase subunit type 1 TsaE [Bacteroidales bacterium]|nr:tRNA (adenosine(37)-N6)-threonylcarbamoyltransferase complex ATPase subunit type 1 TsaE [Bacteroidales bacterium]